METSAFTVTLDDIYQRGKIDHSKIVINKNDPAINSKDWNKFDKSLKSVFFYQWLYHITNVTLMIDRKILILDLIFSLS